MMLTVLFLRSPTNLRAYGADDDKAHPAISVLYSVRATLTNHYWVTSDERRRIAIESTGGEGGIRTLGTGISQYNGLAIHRRVLNRLQNFLLYSSFQRVTNQSI